MNPTSISAPVDLSLTSTPRLCADCGNTFTSDVERKRYCGTRCSKRASRRRQANRRFGPMPNCANCGAVKGSRKGRYCSAKECNSASSRDWWANLPPEQKAATYRQDWLRERSNPDNWPQQGPVRSCANCGDPVATLNARYCPEDECKRAYQRDYTANNPEVFSRNRQARRARLRGAFVDRIDPVVVYKRDKWRCGICGEQVTASLVYPDPMSPSIDHMVPLHLGGKHAWGNVQLAHLICNVRKGTRGGGEQLALI